MANFIPDLVLDTALLVIANEGSRIDICDGPPANYTEATQSRSFGSKQFEEVGTGSPNYSISNGLSSGRRLTVAEQSGITVAQSGTVDHLAITDGISKLLVVVETNSLLVTSGNTLQTPEFDVILEDPA